MSKILDLLANIPTVTVLRERIALIREQAQILEKQMEACQKENARLKEEIAHLHKDLSTYRKAEEFVEHRGALFKRKSGGGYHLVVYCPLCHSSTSALEPGIQFACTDRCGWIANFKGMDLDGIIKELP